MRLRWVTAVLVIVSMVGVFMIGRLSAENSPSRNANPHVASNGFSHFTPLSASFATTDYGWALGTATCHLGRECLVLQATVDGGHAWTPVVLPASLIKAAGRTIQRPSPYLPSNGFAMQDTGFVPTYVLQTLQEMMGIKSSKPSTITTHESKDFGPVRCLTQSQGPTNQTTCVNHDGFVVSWVLDNGSGYSSRATLTAFSRTPSTKDFTTLIKPTKSLILPAV